MAAWNISRDAIRIFWTIRASAVKAGLQTPPPRLVGGVVPPLIPVDIIAARLIARLMATECLEHLHRRLAQAGRVRCRAA